MSCASTGSSGCWARAVSGSRTWRGTFGSASATRSRSILPRDFASRASGAAVEPLSASGRGDFDWGMERFLGEARALAQFAHPSLVGVVRYFRANGTAYIVMEYVEGELLSDHLAREAPLSEPALRGILEPLMDGLSEVHAAGYLHRDIKPENIVLRAGGGLVLQFILHHKVLWSGSDVDTAVATVEEAQVVHPDLRACSFDRSFHSLENRARLDGLLDLNVLPRKGSPTRAEQERESDGAFVAAPPER